MSSTLAINEQCKALFDAYNKQDELAQDQALGVPILWEVFAFLLRWMFCFFL